MVGALAALLESGGSASSLQGLQSAVEDWILYADCESMDSLSGKLPTIILCKQPS